jgi:hypothetical protein
MKQHFVADLAPGNSVNSTFLVQGKERKINRSGKAYVDLELRDSTGTVRGMHAQYEADRYRTGDWTTRNRALGRELLKKPTP